VFPCENVNILKVREVGNEVFLNRKAHLDYAVNNGRELDVTPLVLLQLYLLYEFSLLGL
jgi:hypothetical protein